MATLNQFSERMKKRGARVATRVDAVVRETALAADQTVVLATPVDTGRARSNWQVQLNGPVDTARDAYVDGAEGSTRGQNAQAAIEQARAVISGYNGSKDRAIHITNNLPYIGRLNEGSSAQAPAGFVEEAVHVAAETIRKSKLLL